MARDDKPDDDAKRAAHMARRKGHGLSYREIAQEFGVSKSTAHRRVSGQSAQALRQGFTRIGRA